MSIFSKLFKKKEQYQLTEKDIKWNKLWELFGKGSLKEPYNTLADYCSGINGEGHYCYFDNHQEELDMMKKELEMILDESLFQNFMIAYTTYQKDEDDIIEEKCSKCDKFFYDHENVYNQILQDYANTLE